MSDDAARRFYTERIPAQFNRALDAQAAAGEAGARVHAEMKAVNASLRIVVEGEGGGTFHLDIAGGHMAPATSPSHPLLLTLVHDRAALAALEREAGDSALAFLGGLAGLAGDIKLTAGRMRSLASLDGALRFELTGEDGFAVVTRFGRDAAPEAPRCTIRLDRETYAALRSGALEAQDAFLGGAVQVEGDVQLAIEIALTALSPD